MYGYRVKAGVLLSFHIEITVNDSKKGCIAAKQTIPHFSKPKRQQNKDHESERQSLKMVVVISGG